jgi:hypothetical protein
VPSEKRGRAVDGRRLLRLSLVADFDEVLTVYRSEISAREAFIEG